MRKLTALAALALAAVTTSTAFAQPKVISNLSEGALMGQLQSTAQLQDQFTHNAPLLADATVRLGLTREDFAAVRRAVINGGARYVELPTHLEGMSGSYNGKAFAVHDVIIPAGVYGWEVDLDKPTEVVRVFVPNKCGNISYIRYPKRQIIAAAPPYHQIAAAPIETAPPVIATPAPPVEAAAPVAFVPAAPVVAAAAHHLALLPLLFGGLIAGALMSHGGGSHTISAPGITKIPTPIVTVCPSAAPPGH